MMTSRFSVIVMLMMASVAWGKKDKGELVGTPCKTPCTVTLPAPLRCGKYQHIEYESCPESAKRLDFVNGTWSCAVEEKSYCADNLHTVTEKEWQELMRRLRTLDNMNGNKSDK